MNITILDKRVKPLKTAVNVYKVSVSFIDTDKPSVTEIRKLSETLEYLSVVQKYIDLLAEDHNNWCNIEPYMIVEAAKLIGVSMVRGEEDDFFPQHSDYIDYMARPESYKVTYVDSNGVEFKCDVTS